MKRNSLQMHHGWMAPALATGLGAWMGLIPAAGFGAPATVKDAPLDPRRDAAVRAIEEVMPCVVNISTETIVEIRDPFEHVFRDFFGPNWGRRTQKQQSLGSGVMIDENGYLLTNFHVVQRATRIMVTVWHAGELKAFEADRIGDTFRGGDIASRSDIALLKIVTTGNEKFKAIKLATDDDVYLGETVLALGNPYGLGGSVSRGIISSLARRPAREDEPLAVADWLQTDAAINPGNSGGPLVNLNGELIGMNVAVHRQAQGIGFAIPVKRISEALSEIFTPDYVQGLWFGGRFKSENKGVVANVVQPGSPAHKSGLEVGDRVLQVNGRTLQNVVEVNRELIASGAHQEIRMTVQRGRQRKEISVQLVPKKDFFNAELIRKKSGLALQEMTPELAAQLRLGTVQGLVIADVEPGSPAEAVNLRPGYLLQTVAGHPVLTIEHAAELFYGIPTGGRAPLKLIVPRREGRILHLLSATAEVQVR